ncbi:hypothetical protein CVT25_007948 [Psilocybe cyanescens]|uniref:Uncharacterized protein n=1 Tax=Psilocybe cyanescens TaxID=93625 RepID=A0A409XR50_PSICY|nr:hypothetical protein CVT25_007948 [Psilocybe cyanescens]
MNNSSYDGLNVQKPSNDPPASSNGPDGSTVGLADFQFKKIGQPPTLLQRLSASGPDIDMSQDYNAESRSPSPDLEDELLISDSSPETMNAEQPSLIARIAMSETTASAIDKINVDESMPRYPGSLFTVIPSQINGRSSTEFIASGNPQPNFSKASTTSDQANVNKTSVTLQAKFDTSTSASASSSSKTHEPSNHSSNIRQQLGSTPASASNFPFLNSNIDANPSVSMRHVSTMSQLPPPANGAQSNSAASSYENSSLPSLRDLQSQLSSTMSTVHPMDTTNILHLAQSAKDQCAELISASRKACELAQQSLASANQSLEVSQHCIRLAETLQTRTDMFSSAVEKLDLARDKQWTDSMKAVVSQMDQRINIDEQEARDAESRREQELRATERTKAGLLETSPTGFAAPPSPNTIESTLRSSILGFDSNSALASVEDEANAAALEWSRLCEETAAQKKADAEKMAQNRAVQEAFEAQLAHSKAEGAKIAEQARVKGEESKRKQEEVSRKRADTERALQAKRKLDAEKEKEEEEKAKNMERKALLEQKLAAERKERDRRVREQEERKLKEDEERKRKEDEANARQRAKAQQDEAREEELRKEQVKEQDLRRQEIAAQKQQALIRNAKAARPSKLVHSSQESISQIRLSNPSSGPASRTEAPASSIESAFRNHAPQIASITIGSEVSRIKGAPNIHHIGVPTGKASLSTPNSSTSVSSIAPFVTHSQSNSTATATQIGAQNNRVTKRSSSGLPSPPSEAIQTKAAVRTSIPVYRNNGMASTGNQETAKTPLVKTSPTHSKLPAKPLTSQTTVQHHDISVNRQGWDVGNFPILPRSQLFPISPDAQKANLRSLSEHHGISVKSDPDEVKPFVKTESLFLQESAPVTSDSKSALQLDSSNRKMKVETHDDIDIPRLSMPPSPSSAEFPHNDVLPMFDTAAPESPIAFPPTLPSSSCDLQNAYAVSSKAVRQDNQLNLLPVVSSRSRSAQDLVPCMPTNSGITLPQVPHCHIATNDFSDNADSRMGPDVVVSSGWGQPSRRSPVEAESLGQRHRVVNRPRAPQNIDHYSPSPPPRSRTPLGPLPRSRQLMSRRGDHYSPPRSPEPLSGYSRASPGPSRPQRSGSANNSRGVSPVGQGQGIDFARRNTRPSLTPEPNVQLGRKRMRGDQDHGGPPPRRPRYSEQGPAPGRHEMGQHTFAPPYQSNSYSEEWSHVATYARSPSPEPSRPAALSLRIETSDVEQARSDYRGGTGQHSNVAQRRQNNEHTLSPIQSQSPNFGNNTYASNSYQRQNHREPNHDSQPHLLSRFTDQGRVNTPVEPSQHHPVPHHRAARGRPHKQANPRASHLHQSLEQRISTSNRGPLINRIGQDPSGNE